MCDQEQILKFWDDIRRQNWDSLSSYFHPDAVINWHNTNERFTVEEFVRVNAEYPGDWLIEVERIENADNITISAVRVFSESISFHATSFFIFREGKIAALDEYWGEDEKAPQWRLEARIGKPIRTTI